MRTLVSAFVGRESCCCHKHELVAAAACCPIRGVHKKAAQFGSYMPFWLFQTLLLSKILSASPASAQGMRVHTSPLPQSMYVATWTQEQGWQKGSLQPYGPIQMMPSAQVGRSPHSLACPGTGCTHLMHWPACPAAPGLIPSRTCEHQSVQ